MGKPAVSNRSNSEPRPEPGPSALGSKLRNARKEKGFSLSEVAAATEISASFLSLVENGKSDITIGRLTRLMGFYGLSASDLLPPAELDAVIVRPAERRLLPSTAEGIEFALLTADTDHAMLAMLVSFKRGAEFLEFSSHEGEEFVYVIDGSLVLELEGAEPRVLGPGDSGYYPATRPHLFRNADDSKPLTLVCVGTPPAI